MSGKQECLGRYYSKIPTYLRWGGFLGVDGSFVLDLGDALVLAQMKIGVEGLAGGGEFT